MEEVAVLVLAAAAAHGLARWLSTPPVPLLVVAGAVTAALHPLPMDFLEETITVGVALLLFVAGLELEPGRVRAQRRVALRMGLAQAGVMALVAVGLAGPLGFGPTEAGYLALALAGSSTVVGVRLLRRRRQMFEPFGRAVLGALLLQDLLVIAAMPLVTAAGRGSGGLADALGALAALAAGAWAVRRWLAPWLVRETGEELQLLGALSVLALFVGGAAVLEVPEVVGAFLAGVSLSRFPTNAVLRAEVAPVGDFFTALFFTALGALVIIPSLAELWRAAVLTVAVVLVTPFTVAFVAERSGLSSRSAMEAGLLLAQTSELSLVIGLAGMLAGDLGPDAFTVIVLAAGATMLLTPLVATERMAERLLALHPDRWRRREPSAPPPRGHLLIAGCGSTGREVLDVALLAGVETVVVDQDPSVVQQLRLAGVRSVRGEIGDPRILEAAGASGARAVVSTVSRPRDSERLLASVPRGTPVLVRVFEDMDAGWVEDRGGQPVVSARAAAARLLAWWDGRRARAGQRSDGTPRPAGPS